MKCVQCGQVTSNHKYCMKCLCAKYCKPGMEKDCKLYQQSKCVWFAWINDR